MDVIHYKDQDGNWFLEIKSRQYHALRELEFEHQKLDRPTQVNLYDSCNGVWMLTVQMEKAA